MPITWSSVSKQMSLYWTFFKYRCCGKKMYKFLNLDAPHICLTYQQKVSTVSTVSRRTQMSNMVTIYPSFIEILDIFVIFVVISTFNLEFLWQPLFSPCLSPSGCLCQIWRNSLGAFPTYSIMDNLKNIMLPSTTVVSSRHEIRRSTGKKTGGEINTDDKN